MRIPSGVTDQYIGFVAVDATDFTTRETGLSTFTVYRSRNGGTPAAMTTPTITEADATNMPGFYWLLLDEDMAIDAGDDSQEMAFHITHAGMAPVTRTIELYRPKFTAGSTLSLADINAQCDTALTDYDAPTKAELDSGFAALNDLSAVEVNAQVDAALLDYDGPTKAEMDAGFAALNDLSAAEVNAEVDTALADIHLNQLLAANYDPASKPGVATALLNELVENDGGVSRFTANALEQAPTGGSAPTAAAIADAVWDEAISGHLTAGSTGASLNAAGSAGDPWTTTLPGAYTGSQAGKILADVLADTAEIGAAGAGLSAVPWNSAWDAEVQSEVTDALTAYDPPTRAELTSDIGTVTTAISGLNDFNPASDTVDVGAINGNTEAAADLAASAGTVVRAAAVTGTLSTTQMSTDLTEATDDHYNGRIIIWTSGVLEDQATNITDYDGTTKTLTFTAVTEAPSNGDTFVIV